MKKILPGCEYTQYWYDRADRMAFMRDATLRERGLYRFSLYDSLGRLAVQGTCTDCDRGEQQNIAEFSEIGTGICNTGYKVPLSDKITNPKLETVNYYDSYNFIDGYATMLGNGIADFRVSGASANGLQTGCAQVTSDGGMIMSAFFYDSKGRVSDTRQLLEGKRLTATHTERSYTGKPVRTETKEYDLAGSKRTLNVSQTLENEYSKKTDRLLSATLTVNGRKQTVQRLGYDMLGRVSGITRGGDAGTVSHGYNLHGWTTAITGKDFSEELHYTDGVGTPCHNGNISSMLWQTPEYPQARGYKFSYDGLDRLRESVYGETQSLSDKRNRYNEKVLEYTANGAIKRFQRRGLKDDGEYGKIDNLNIRLNGNQLLSVADDALPVNKYSSMSFRDGANEDVEYTYNGVGALTSDLNRGITCIEYDNLNNPVRILFKDGTVEQITHYYPFGGTFGDAGLTSELQQYKYNGKELDRTAGLNTYDYGARLYFSALPGWDRIDPLCEKDYGTSPYVYCRNNPINVIDRDGNWGVKYIDEQNKTINIIANFYCASQELNGIEQFNDKEVRKLNDFASNQYSDIGIVSRGKYKGYKMTVKLNFLLEDDYISTKIKAEDDVINGARVGNVISKSRTGMNKYLKSSTDNFGIVREKGGICYQPSGEIVMNEAYCTKENIVHEAYHDLGLTHPAEGGRKGVMHYPPQKVSQEEIDKLSEHSNYLYEIFK